MVGDEVLTQPQQRAQFADPPVAVPELTQKPPADGMPSQRQKARRQQLTARCPGSHRPENTSTQFDVFRSWPWPRGRQRAAAGLPSEARPGRPVCVGCRVGTGSPTASPPVSLAVAGRTQSENHQQQAERPRPTQATGTDRRPEPGSAQIEQRRPGSRGPVGVGAAKSCPAVGNGPGMVCPGVRIRAWIDLRAMLLLPDVSRLLPEPATLAAWQLPSRLAAISRFPPPDLVEPRPCRCFVGVTGVGCGVPRLGWGAVSASQRGSPG